MRAAMLFAVTVFTTPSLAAAATLRVGPGQTYSTPSQAAAVAQDGDLIEIAAGTYPRNAATWTANNLTIRGTGGRAHLASGGVTAGGKAIWVIQGANTTVENIEFSGASVPDQNGAGIRQEGAGLIVRNCYFHDNENGILAGANTQSDILVEFSEFARNGFGDGQSHNMYINRVRSFTLQHSYSHHANVGHLVKSRAITTRILYNRLMDEATGNSSYTIDVPNGGTTYIIGNVMQQGPLSPNGGIIALGLEGASNASSGIWIVNNTIVNDRGSGYFVNNNTGASALLANNLFAGGGTVLQGQGTQQTNLVTNTPGLVSAITYDYRLLAGSPLIDAGSDPGMAGSVSLLPQFQYVDPTRRVPRVIDGAIDIGAYELGLMAPQDAGVSPDATPRADAGVNPDAQPAPDAAQPAPDAAAPPAPDAATPLDAGVLTADTGPILDSGTLDAGLVDPDAAAQSADARPDPLGPGLDAPDTIVDPLPSNRVREVAGGCTCAATPSAQQGTLAVLLSIGLVLVTRRRRR